MKIWYPLFFFIVMIFLNRSYTVPKDVNYFIYLRSVLTISSFQSFISFAPSRRWTWWWCGEWGRRGVSTGIYTWRSYVSSLIFRLFSMIPLSFSSFKSCNCYHSTPSHLLYLLTFRFATFFYVFIMVGMMTKKLKKECVWVIIKYRIKDL